MNTTTGSIKTKEEIEILALGGKILRGILLNTAKLAKPGASAFSLDQFAEKEILKAGGKPAFKGYGDKKNPFPSTLCVSLNNVVVHGIPTEDLFFKDGDLVSLDIGMEYKNFYTDTAISVPVGEVSGKINKIIQTTKECLNNAIKQAKPGNRIGDISFAIQKTAETAGFSVVRDLVGHGVGYEVHEEPSIPCFGKPGTGLILKTNMVLAIEPMVCEKDYFLEFDSDGWTISTKDGGLAAHFEHTIAITDYGARILT